MKKLKTLLSSITEGSLTIWDYTLFLLIAIFCALVFQQFDLIHTAACSYGFSNGHFLDFYDYVGSFEIWASYMPSIYLLFGIWNLPMRILGLATVPNLQLGIVPLMWAKILPCLAYLGCGYLTYQICLAIGMSGKRAKLCMYAMLTCPIGIYGQFIFGQYDSFVLFLSLLAIYFYLKENGLGFVLCFGIAMTFKYTALLLFLPLLFLKEKNVWKIVAACILVCIPFALEYLIYHNSPMFQSWVFGMGGYDGPSTYVFQTGLSIGYVLSGLDYQINLILFVFACVCAWAYFTDIKGKVELAQWAFFLCCLSMFAIFGLCKYHPQWLVLAVPFWVISAFLNRKTKIFMIIDIIFMLFFVAFHVQIIPNNVDQAMFNYGILKYLLPNREIGTELTMADIFSMLSPAITLSFNSAIMFVYAIFKHPKYDIENIQEEPEPMMGWLRTRLVLGVSIFVLPAFLCLSAVFSNPVRTMSTGEYDSFVTDIGHGAEVCQRFLSEGDSISKVKIGVGVQNTVNQGTLNVALRDPETGVVLYDVHYDISGWFDLQLIPIDMGDTAIEKGKYYEIVFALSDFYEGCKFCLVTSHDPGDAIEGEDVYVNKEKQNYWIRMDVYQ